MRFSPRARGGYDRCEDRGGKEEGSGRGTVRPTWPALAESDPKTVVLGAHARLCRARQVFDCPAARAAPPAEGKSGEGSLCSLG
jgi:hypothetical protein